MIHLKTKQEIEIMRKCGQILKKSVDELLPQIRSGITTLEIDNEAERLIKQNGGESSFSKVPGYKWTTCLPINEQAVHTPPGKRKLKPGDVLTIDIGAYYQGYHSDYATTLIVDNEADDKVRHFLQVGQTALDKAIAQAKVGNRIGHISQAGYNEVTKNGYCILKELTGHGIGHELHEDPYVPNFLDRPIEKTYKLQSGLVIAVEVIYSMGSEEIAYEKAGEWSIISLDRSLCACFEKTIAIEDENTFILT